MSVPGVGCLRSDLSAAIRGYDCFIHECMCNHFYTYLLASVKYLSFIIMVENLQIDQP